MKKAILDLDGTLLNSKKRHELVLRDALKQYELEHLDISDYMCLKESGLSTKSYLIKVKNINKEKVELITNWWVEHIEDDYYLKNDIWYEDSREFVDFLHSNSYEIHILTSRKNKKSTTEMIKKFDRNNNIKLINIVNPLKAIEEKKNYINNMNKEDVYIGDSEVDYYANKEKEINLYLLNRGFRNKDYWNKLNIKTYDSLKEIRKFLIKTNN